MYLTSYESCQLRRQVTRRLPTDRCLPALPTEPEPAPPSEECVRHLVEMGFQRAQVETALRTSNNDMNLATTLLLQQS